MELEIEIKLYPLGIFSEMEYYKMHSLLCNLHYQGEIPVGVRFTHK